MDKSLNEDSKILAEVRDAVLADGLQDWVMAEKVLYASRNLLGREGTKAVDLAFATIREMLHHGMMEAGQISDEGFVAWTLSPDGSADEVERIWRNLGHEPRMGEICWFRLTPEGEELAMRLAST